RLQLLRHLHSCSGCFRLERSPGGTCTHWKAPPYHGAHPMLNSPDRKLMHCERYWDRAPLMSWVTDSPRTSRCGHSGLMPANLTTLPHFSVSLAMSLPNSVGESGRTVPPSSVSRALTLGSPRPALISLLSLSMTSLGVSLGAPRPSTELTS